MNPNEEEKRVRARALSGIAEAMVHDFEEKKRIDRAVYATGFGFIPGSGPVHIENHESKSSEASQAASQPSSWAKPVLAGLLGAALTAGAAGWLLRPPATPTQAAPIKIDGGGGISNKTGKPIEIDNRVLENGQLVSKFRWRFMPEGPWSEWKTYDPKVGITVP